MSQARYQHPTYMVRKKLLRLFGASVHVFNPQGGLEFFCDMKAFKLKEDIRVYADESRQQELLTIRARNILDFSATYDVFDPGTGQTVGALRRRGFKSMVKDEWVFLNAQDQEVGLIQEDSLTLALIRRFLCDLVPQSYHGTLHGQPVCHFQQHFNLLVTKLTLDFTPDTGQRLDRRLGIAAAILLCAIEGKQE